MYQSTAIIKTQTFLELISNINLFLFLGGKEERKRGERKKENWGKRKEEVRRRRKKKPTTQWQGIFCYCISSYFNRLEISI